MVHQAGAGMRAEVVGMRALCCRLEEGIACSSCSSSPCVATVGADG